MAWSNSKIFTAFIKDALDRTNAFDVDGDTLKAALYGAITPDNTVAAASSAYNTGQWVVGSEISHVSHWAVAGQTIGTVTSTFSGTTYTLDAADTASVDSATTLSGVFGCLVHDSTLTTPVAKQGICYNYFGGTQSVTAGSFTIVWNASGILSISVA